MEILYLIGVTASAMPTHSPTTPQLPRQLNNICFMFSVFGQPNLHQITGTLPWTPGIGRGAFGTSQEKLKFAIQCAGQLSGQLWLP